MYCCAVPHFQVLGIYWNHVSDTAGILDEISSREVQEHNGGQHDILVLLQHTRSTDVCSFILPRRHEQASPGK
uniref:Uncharacterized protein n=1 Tax=Arundo donax TaxID=35708 RepID=A0A0A9GFG9_ARUDO